MIPPGRHKTNTDAPSSPRNVAVRTGSGRPLDGGQPKNLPACDKGSRPQLQGSLVLA